MTAKAAGATNRLWFAEYATLIASLILLRLATTLSFQLRWLGMLPLIPLVAIGATNCARIAMGRKIRFTRGIVWPLLVVALYVVAFARAASAGTLSTVSATLQGAQLVIVAVFLTSTLLIARPPVESHRLTRGVYYSVFCLVALNVTLFLAGVSPLDAPYTADTPSSLLGALGFDVARVYFPLAPGINSFGIIAGALAAASLVPLLRRSRVREARDLGRPLLLAGVLLGVCVMLLTDSRSGIVYLLVASFVLLLPRGVSAAGLALLPIAAIVLPIVLLATTSAVPEEVAAEFGRSGTAAEVSTLTGRSILWENSLGYLREFRLGDMLGHGAYGDVPIGVASQNAANFQGTYAESLFHGPHNMALQAIFDVGYLGLAAIVVGLGYAVSRLRRSADVQAASFDALLAFMAFAMLAAATERVPLPYSPELFFVVLAGMLIAASARPLHVKETAQAAHAEELLGSLRSSDSNKVRKFGGP